AYRVSAGDKIALKVTAKGGNLTAEINGRKTFDCRADVRKGCVGAYVSGGSVVKFDRFVIKEI
ncbi:MAG: hypothetical protein K2L87_01825, partial [Clostridiales bacterium]|nr:hypothetical protein [Clostridiales bacterium]